MKYIIFSDTHYAEYWDDLERCIIKHDICKNYLNPNSALKILVKELNDNYSSKGCICINLGDIVDYIYPKYKYRKKITKTNYDGYYSIIKNLKFKYLEIPGNHDYRFLRYNLKFYGLAHVNINEEKLEIIRDKCKDHEHRSFWNEILSIFILKKASKSLKYFKGIKTIHYEIIANDLCIFINTKEDAFVNPFYIFRYLKKLYYMRYICNKRIIKMENSKSFIHALSHDVIGITMKEIKYIDDILKSFSRKSIKNVFIFMHAPIFSSNTNNSISIYGTNFSDIVISAWRKGLGNDVMLSGGGELLEIISRYDMNFFLFSGHTHREQYYLISKSKPYVKRCSIYDINNMSDDHDYVKHITTPPIGAIDTSSKFKYIGYLVLDDLNLTSHIVKRF